jgi:hypothetical protein
MWFICINVQTGFDVYTRYGTDGGSFDVEEADGSELYTCIFISAAA